MSLQDVTQSSLCAGVKECGTKHAHNFLFPKSSCRIWRTSLGDVQRFCCHSWCNATVIFEQISNSSNVYPSSSRFWMATSLVIFYQLLSISKSWIPPRKFDRFREPHSHKPFASILVFPSQIDWLWNKILWQLSLRFCHPWCIKKTDFTRQVITRILSKINETQCVNRCWLIVLSGLADRSF